jgi:PAS domain S-box-containing protein
MPREKGRILVIDDHQQNLVLAEDTLNDGGYESLLASDGLDGMKIVTEQSPDVILLDIMMPKIDGLEVCRRLRSSEYNYDGKIIMVTAKARTEDKVKGLDAGADDYITKPYEPEELIARVTTQYKAKKGEDAVRESESKMRAVMDTTSNSIITLDTERVIQSVNPATEKLFGYSDNYLVGKNISILVPEQLQQAHKDGFERYLRTGEKKIMGKWVEISCVKSDGSTFQAELNIADWRLGTQRMFTGFLHDITGRKLMEVERERLVRQSVASLAEAKAARKAAESATKELKRTLIISDELREEAMVARGDAEAYAEETERANRSKSEFLSNMSHELRTPMHGILSFSEMGIDDANEGNTSEMTHYFTRIQESGKRLLALLNDLLDISKLEAGKVDYKMGRNDLKEVVESTISELHSIIKERSIVITMEPSGVETSAWFDREKIHQVVYNILSNAIKFSPDEGIIRFYFNSEILSQEGNEGIPALSIEIQDEGVGIPEDELEAVFDKFVQSKKTKTGAGGTGLGLSISKEIISAHGGYIKAGNNTDGGAFFHFALPKKEPADG